MDLISFILVNLYGTLNLLYVLITPPEYKTFYALKGATEWRDRLPSGFDYRVLVGYHEICNVNFETVDSIFDPYLSPLGRTTCEYDSTKWVNGDNVLLLNTTNWCNVEIRPNADYGNTIKHEMGHVLGVGHRSIYNGSDVNLLVQTIDIMLPQQFGIQKLSDASLDVLKLIYGLDGWADPNYYSIITAKVIHP